MTRFRLPAIAALGFIVSAGSAFAVESNVSVPSTTPPDALWKKAGDFCGLKAWVSAIENCVLSADGKQRTLTLRGGGTIVEHLDKWDDANRSYTYSIISSPLPVSAYRSTFSIAPDAKGSVVKWHSTYDAKGVSDAEAKKLVDGMYESGAKGLVGN